MHKDDGQDEEVALRLDLKILATFTGLVALSKLSSNMLPGNIEVERGSWRLPHHEHKNLAHQPG